MKYTSERFMTDKQLDLIQFLNKLNPTVSLEAYMGNVPLTIGGRHIDGGCIYKYADYISNTFGSVYKDELQNGEANFSIGFNKFTVTVVQNTLWIELNSDLSWKIEIKETDEVAILKTPTYNRAIKWLTIPKLDKIISSMPYDSKIDRLVKNKALKLYNDAKAKEKLNWMESRDI